MKILFVCGSLEPGRDGVGDYARRLAGELSLQGHQPAILAINDRRISEKFTGIQHFDGAKLPVLRLPSSLPEKKRFTLSKQWVDEFNPSYISLQFVPFAFHKKGLSFGLAGKLAKLGGTRRWQVMVHELWVGMNTESSLKHFAWGWLQKKLIVALLKKLKPVVIHTQASLYIAQLQKMGFNPVYLPLFSNIPVKNGGLKDADKLKLYTQPKKISFVLFAGIHTGAPVKQFAREVAGYAKQTGREFLLIIIGRSGTGHKDWADAWAAEGLEVDIMGEQPPEKVSAVFCNASAGISTTPFALIGKSGAVAAMREHGLPVICVSYPWTPRNITSLYLPDGIAEYPHWNIETYTSVKKSVPVAHTISSISKQFIHSLLVC